MLPAHRNVLEFRWICQRQVRMSDRLSVLPGHEVEAVALVEASERENSPYRSTSSGTSGRMSHLPESAGTTEASRKGGSSTTFTRFLNGSRFQGLQTKGSVSRGLAFLSSGAGFEPATSGL
jgi:hypothetical protein